MTSVQAEDHIKTSIYGMLPLVSNESISAVKKYINYDPQKTVSKMNFDTLILLFVILANLGGIQGRPSSKELGFRPLDGYLSRSSRDLVHWNRVTNKINLYE